MNATSFFSVCEGIADLSIQEEAENFKERAAEWILETRKHRDSRKPAPEVFHYKNLFWKESTKNFICQPNLFCYNFFAADSLCTVHVCNWYNFKACQSK